VVESVDEALHSMGRRCGEVMRSAGVMWKGRERWIVKEGMEGRKGWRC